MARQRAGRRERRAGGRGGHHPASRDIDDADYEWYRYLGEGRGGAPSGPDRRAPASSEPPRTGPGRLAGGTAGRRAADEQSRPLYPSWDDDYARPLYPAQDLAAPARPAPGTTGPGTGAAASGRARVITRLAAGAGRSATPPRTAPGALAPAVRPFRPGNGPPDPGRREGHGPGPWPTVSGRPGARPGGCPWRTGTPAPRPRASGAPAIRCRPATWTSTWTGRSGSGSCAAAPDVAQRPGQGAAAGPGEAAG